MGAWILGDGEMRIFLFSLSLSLPSPTCLFTKTPAKPLSRIFLLQRRLIKPNGFLGVGWKQTWAPLLNRQTLALLHLQPCVTPQAQAGPCRLDPANILNNIILHCGRPFCSLEDVY